MLLTAEQEIRVFQLATKIREESVPGSIVDVCAREIQKLLAGRARQARDAAKVATAKGGR